MSRITKEQDLNFLNRFAGRAEQDKESFKNTVFARNKLIPLSKLLKAMERAKKVIKQAPVRLPRIKELRRLMVDERMDPEVKVAVWHGELFLIGGRHTISALQLIQQHTSTNASDIEFQVTTYRWPELHLEPNEADFIKWLGCMIIKDNASRNMPPSEMTDVLAQADMCKTDLLPSELKAVIIAGLPKNKQNYDQREVFRPLEVYWKRACEEEIFSFEHHRINIPSFISIKRELLQHDCFKKLNSFSDSKLNNFADDLKKAACSIKYYYEQEKVNQKTGKKTIKKVQHPTARIVFQIVQKLIGENGY